MTRNSRIQIILLTAAFAAVCAAIFIISANAAKTGKAWERFKTAYKFYEQNLKPSTSEENADIIDYDMKGYFENGGYREIKLPDGRIVVILGCELGIRIHTGIFTGGVYEDLASYPCYGVESAAVMQSLDRENNPYIMINFWSSRAHPDFFVLDVNRKKFIFDHSGISPEIVNPMPYKLVVTGEYKNNMKIITINDEKTGKEIFRFFWKPDKQEYDWQ
jgi:hypothetical protein